MKGKFSIILIFSLILLAAGCSGTTFEPDSEHITTGPYDTSGTDDSDSTEDTTITDDTTTDEVETTPTVSAEKEQKIPHETPTSIPEDLDLPYNEAVLQSNDSGENESSGCNGDQ